jgi:hypothetical protein
MARDITFVNQGNRLMLQGLEGHYYAPKKELVLQNDFPNYRTMNLAQLKSMIQTDFIKDFKDTNGDTVTFYDDTPQHFYFRDGKTDVYTKGGLDYQVFEYLDRQLGESQKWRLETNCTQVDFRAGGKVVIAGRDYIILKVLTILTTGTRSNKFMAMRTPNNWQRYGNKLLACV